MANKKFESVNILELCMAGAMIIQLVLLGIFTDLGPHVFWLLTVHLVLIIIYTLSAFQMSPFKKKNFNTVVKVKAIKFISIILLLLLSLGLGWRMQFKNSQYNYFVIYILFAFMFIFSILSITIYTSELISVKEKYLRKKNERYVKEGANKKFKLENLQLCMAGAIIIHLVLLSIITDIGHAIVLLLPGHFVLMIIYIVSAFKVLTLKKKSIVIKYILIFSLLLFSWVICWIAQVMNTHYYDNVFIHISFSILVIFSIIIFSAEIVSFEDKKLQGEKLIIFKGDS